MGVSKNKRLFPARTIGVCFVPLEVKPSSSGICCAFPGWECWEDPQKNTIPQILSLCWILLDSALETQPQPACQGNTGLFTALNAPLSPCSGFTPWFGQVYSSSQCWASTRSTDSIPLLPLTEFLLLQALPSFLPQAGKMTLLAQALCHSIAVVNKILSVCPCCFSSMALSVCWSFFPIHRDTNPTRCYSIPQVPTVQESIHFKRQKDCLFLGPAFPSPPLPGSLGGVGCETKPFLRLLTCTGELRGEFGTSCKTDSSGLHSSPRSCSPAWIIDQTHQWLFSAHVLGYGIASCWGYSWN